MKRCLIVFGTRPEAIKMAPLVKAIENEEGLEAVVCVTAQHREMLDGVLEFFEISPNYDLDVMVPEQTLPELQARILQGMDDVLQDAQPDLVFVHGDTTTTLAASMAAFYAHVPVCHVEAGLRTYNLEAPFPEEMNRQVTDVLSRYHFAPTATAKANLKSEQRPAANVLVTGNTVIDALQWGLKKMQSDGYQNAEIDTLKQMIDAEKKLILVTAHRRENLGKGMEEICRGILDIAEKHNDVQIIYPMHLNPKVQEPVRRMLGGAPNILLIEPLGYAAFLWLMNASYMIITDSGGIQEEAPSLGKPVLLMRDATERPEAVESGFVELVGADCGRISTAATYLLTHKDVYLNFAKSENPYGDGKACERIVDFVKGM
ncbi:MAG: UDP-N-acetylglucosamine 2-epimerase (non-hydrolyzing) [Weeksellaceae bacterium]|nr:UDP-N-acetylglucosamine 2-epimerase (non-hydrolyzing) [Weeksellaceae bacterium]